MNVLQRFLISNATNQPLGETGDVAADAPVPLFGTTYNGTPFFTVPIHPRQGDQYPDAPVAETPEPSAGENLEGREMLLYVKWAAILAAAVAVGTLTYKWVK